jgi:hypothetical protein
MKDHVFWAVSTIYANYSLKVSRQRTRSCHSRKTTEDTGSPTEDCSLEQVVNLYYASSDVPMEIFNPLKPKLV